MSSRSPELQEAFDEIMAARQDHERVLRLLAAYPDDDDADAVLIGAEALVALGRVAFAEEAYQEALRLRPGDPTAESGLALVKLLRAADDAEAAQADASTDAPADAPADAPSDTPADTPLEPAAGTPADTPTDAPAEAPPETAGPETPAPTEGAETLQMPLHDEPDAEAEPAPVRGQPEEKVSSDDAGVQEAALTLAEFASRSGAPPAHAEDASPEPDFDVAHDPPAPVVAPMPEALPAPDEPPVMADAPVAPHEPEPIPEAPPAPEASAMAGASPDPLLSRFAAKSVDAQAGDATALALPEPARPASRAHQVLAVGYLILGALALAANAARFWLTGSLDVVTYGLAAGGVATLAVAWPLARAHVAAWWAATSVTAAGAGVGAGGLAAVLTLDAHVLVGLTWEAGLAVAGTGLVTALGLTLGLWRARHAFRVPV